MGERQDRDKGYKKTREWWAVNQAGSVYCSLSFVIVIYGGPQENIEQHETTKQDQVWSDGCKTETGGG